ncbi:MAG: hypothetical protein OXE17_02695 [Chloroflexi bacterium]|nr:hypothetical protein [Chloroflexota bacterium]
MTSRADTHDLDKLRRWQQDLEDSAADAPPVFAVFLVDGGDRTAHDVFRAFRAGFEECSLGFAHLVIFGQHGVSETATKLRDRFGLKADTRPQLVLYSGEGSQPQILTLPAGEGSALDDCIEKAWRRALEQAIEVVGAAPGEKGEPLGTLKAICAELLSAE